MNNVVAAGNAEHYHWGDGCDGWFLVQRDDLSVIQERVPPGRSERIHYHTKARQFFFVLDGTATLEIYGKQVVLKEQEGVEVPPMIPHRLRNDSNVDLIFLIVSAPKSHGDRVNL
jgi:mannose-6-phosphate isomerase-like protein (cupin superfamily)